MKAVIKFLLTIVFVVFFTAKVFAATFVALMYGLGDNAFGSSAGIDTIAAEIATMPGVTVKVYDYWQTQDIANDVMAAPAGTNIVIGGYSCGANSPTTIALGLNGHRKVNIVGIQESLWCGGYPLSPNILRAQETYASGFVGCLITLGFGCKPYVAGAGFKGTLLLINRPDLHPEADLDTNAQTDVVDFVRSIANPAMGRHFRTLAPIVGHVMVVVRYSGQRAYR